MATIETSEVMGKAWQCTNCTLNKGKTIYFDNQAQVQEHIEKHAGKVQISVEQHNGRFRPGAINL